MTLSTELGMNNEEFKETIFRFDGMTPFTKNECILHFIYEYLYMKAT